MATNGFVGPVYVNDVGTVLPSATAFHVQLNPLATAPSVSLLPAGATSGAFTLTATNVLATFADLAFAEGLNTALIIHGRATNAGGLTTPFSLPTLVGAGALTTATALLGFNGTTAGDVGSVQNRYRTYPYCWCLECKWISRTIHRTRIRYDYSIYSSIIPCTN